MKNLILLSLLIMHLLVSCNRSSKNENKLFTIDEIGINESNELLDDFDSRSYFIEDSVMIKLNVYLPHDKIITLMDSIIQIVRECSNPRKNIIGFAGGGKMALSFKITVRKENKIIEVRTISMHITDFSKFHGFFDFQEFRVFCQGDFLDNLLLKTQQVNLDKYVDPEKLIIDIDDSDYYWYYIEEESNFYAFSFNDCNTHWTDWPTYNKLFD